MINKYESNVKAYSVLDVEGNITVSDYKVPLTNDQLINSYYYMKLSRELDIKMIKMQRQGRMLTFPPNMGEEGLQIGVALSMDKNDWFAPAFRSGALMLHQGVPTWQMLLLWNGNELGNKIPEGLNILPVNVPIATQYSHAAGIGIALNLQGKPNVAYTFIGDGGTAEGEFYEATNFASLRNAQTVFCINNNQWAISTPTKRESGQPCLASKAIAAGLCFIKVDGNDLFASYDAAVAARNYVLEHKKPILVEFQTYRMGPHTTSDNPRVYRSEEYEKEEEKKDPIVRLEKYMLKNGILTQQMIDEFNEKIEAHLNQSVETMQSKLSVSVDDIFDHTFKTLDESLQEQKEEVLKLYGGK